jgi:23S rRNA U2552 (ribose-2'-O)-methylase RlmE/FtsJ
MLAVEWPLVRAAVAEDAEATPPALESKVFARLARVKARVPDVDRRAWDRAVATVTAPLPSNRKVTSRAYYKLHEIVRSCVLPVPQRALLLCEAPGGFVQCVNEWAPHATWTALTLPGGIAPCTDLLDTSKGAFVLDDVFRVAEKEDAPLCADECDLVTADGALEMDHGSLEAQHYPLLVAQTTVALRALGKGGTFVIKFFEGATRETQAWIAWLTTRFEHVSLIKPNSSRSTNSERYLVARGYDGVRGEEFKDVAVASMWARDLQRVVERMATEQADAIERALARIA